MIALICYWEHFPSRWCWQRLFEFFKNACSTSILHIFLDCIPNIDVDNPADGTILKIARLDARIIINNELLTVQVKRGGGRQNGVNILDSSKLKLAYKQSIFCIIDSVDEWMGNRVEGTEMSWRKWERKCIGDGTWGCYNFNASKSSEPFD